MIVTIQHVLDGIFHRPDTVYCIPKYQRNYDWKQKQCERLLSDILALAEQPEKEHFLGTMVIAQDQGRVDCCRYFVIDGQQRLTTLSLLLKAVQDEAKRRNEPELVQKTAGWLGNSADACCYRLEPQQTDYDELMLGCMSAENSSNICLNYAWFQAQLQGVDDLGALVSAMNRCTIITIQLEDGKDNPQLIFETLNSTGKPLSEADKIRNYLLLTDKNIKQPSTLWDKLNSILMPEPGLDPDARLQTLNDFFATYLMSRTRKSVLQEEQYEEFKKLCGDDKMSCLRELIDYAGLYRMMMCPQEARGISEGLRNRLAGLHEIDMSTCRPFIMCMLHDWLNPAFALSDPELEQALALITNYLVRRSICGIPSASMRKFFLTLHNRVFRYNETRRHYAESLALFLVREQAGTASAFPGDAEFTHALTEGDVYHKSLCRYLLFLLENQGNERLKDTREITIEHILPQRPGAEWMRLFPDDEERQTLVHSLGNLTLTGNNSTLSNKPFLKKMELYRDSKATRLNQYIKEQTEWTPEHIRTRSRSLCECLLAYFPMPAAEPNPAIVFEKGDIITPETPEKGTKRRLHKAVLEGRTLEANNFAVLLQAVAIHLDSAHPERVAAAAREFPRLIYPAGGTHKSTRDINGSWVVDCSGSTEVVIRNMARLLEFYGYEPESLQIYLKDAQAEDSEENSALCGKRAAFWKFFLDYAREHRDAIPPAFSLPSPGNRSYITISFGNRGYDIVPNIKYLEGKLEAKFYIENDKPFLHRTERSREYFESAVGAPLYWHEAKQHCYIYATHPLNLDAPDTWQDAAAWLLEISARLYQTFSPLV